MSKIVEYENAKEEVLNSLKNGEVIALPTETVYGLGVIYDNYEAYEKLNEIKRRPSEQPYSLMLGNINEIEQYAFLDEDTEVIVNKFLPGQLTIILKAKDHLPAWAKNKNDGTIGIRVPSTVLTRVIINDLGKPLLVPSANRHNEAPINNEIELENEFNNEISYIIKKNEEMTQTPTTVLLAYGKIKILREGKIKQADIENVIGRKLDE